MTKPELVYVNHIRATPQKVWQALTDPAFTERYWYGTKLESDRKVGSPIVFRKPQGEPDTGKVLVADKPHKLSFSWHSNMLHTPHEHTHTRHDTYTHTKHTHTHHMSTHVHTKIYYHKIRSH